MIYHKIMSPFKRDNRTNRYTKEYASPEIKCLSGADRIFKDKIDGTNIRVMRDGYDLSFGGRKDKSEIPEELLACLQKIFKEELIEERFGSTPVVLYGEGYGGKIQGGLYDGPERFVLFDIMINNTFIEYQHVENVAKSLGIDCVPLLCTGNIEAGINYVRDNDLVEGLVGIPTANFLDRKGNRIIIKLKNRDIKIND